jgi:hypothetical protein
MGQERIPLGQCTADESPGCPRRSRSASTDGVVFGRKRNVAGRVEIGKPDPLGRPEKLGVDLLTT